MKLSWIKSAFLFLSLLSWVTRPVFGQIPSDFPEITLGVSDDPVPGYVFLSDWPFFQQSDYGRFLMMLDNSGYPAYWMRLETPMNLDFKQLEDGNLSYNDMREFAVLDKEFTMLYSYAAGNGIVTDVHEIRILPDGHALLLGWTTRRVDMTAYGGHSDALLQDYLIQEVDTLGTVYWQWNTADHFDIEDTTPDIDLTGVFIDWVHCNAIEVDTDGNILLSSRHLDEITKIDRGTGEVIWRLGGKKSRNNQFVFTNDFLVESGDTLFWGFSHQHGIRRLGNGHIVLFDNGNLKDPPFSRVVEYSLDEVEMTATKVWEYRNDPDVFSQEMGFAQRLPSGNTLIGWGGEMDHNLAATEVRPDGSKTFEVSFPEDIVSYRAFKFIVNMAAVTRDVTTPGVYDFNEPDNSTGVSMNVQQLAGTGTITVSEHYYAPHLQDFTSGTEPDSVCDLRWVVTAGGASGIEATIRLDIDRLPEITDPSHATLYRRPEEGEGSFAPVPTTYMPADFVLEASFPGIGEWMVGYRSALGGFDESPPPMPKVARLGQNVPNPFNGDTVIRYAVPERGPVSLKVYDMLGRFVATLADGEVEAGVHDAVFEMGNRPSGVYLYQLKWHGRTYRRKMVILR